MGSFAVFPNLLLWVCLIQASGICVASGYDNGGTMVLGLRHRGFAGSPPLSSLQMLKVSSSRSWRRLENLRRNNHVKKQRKKFGGDGVSLPLRASSDYIMPLMLGSPAQRVEVFMDTGSDLVWVPCSAKSSEFKSTFECIMCSQNSSEIPTFWTAESKSIREERCSSDACTAIHNSNNNNDVCTMAGCPFDSLEMYPCHKLCPQFYYAYGDGSLRGRLMRDKLTLGPRRIHNFTFGCAGITLGEAIGVAGFGKGYLSFPSQLAELGSGSFSYCLVSHKFDDNLQVSSPLVVGDSAIPSKGTTDTEIQYTPMINNARYPTFYYIGVEAISIGRYMVKLPAYMTSFDEQGNGGFIIDTGTTFTMIPNSIYRQVINILKVEVQYSRSIGYQQSLGLDLCYNLPDGQDSPAFPTMMFHFKNNATIAIPPENYLLMMDDEEDQTSSSAAVACLVILNSGNEIFGPAAVLGNYQQQNLQVVYDMDNQRIGFAPKACSPLS